jgi:Amt family ammonium transporter
MKIAVNTTLAAGAGGIGALALIWVITKKADLSMALNGVLGGLVSICTACDVLGNGQTIVLALIAGAVVVGGVYLLEKLKIDDPVGAFPVHGLCGVLGVLAPPLFGLDGFTIGAQLTGFAVIAIFAFVTSFGLFTVLRLFGIARVSAEVESEGLDVVEHGMEAYAITAE